MRLEDLPERYREQARRQLSAVPRLASVLLRRATPAQKGAGTPHERGSRGFVSLPVGNAGKAARAEIAAKSAHGAESHALIRYITLDTLGSERIVDVGLDPSDIKTAQQKGVGRTKDGKLRFFTKKSVMAWEKPLVKALSEYVGDFAAIREKAKKCGLRVTICFAFPYPENAPHKIRTLTGSAMVRRPDVDNLAKGVLDCMSRAGLIDDDNCITTLILNKWRSKNDPSVKICVRPDHWESAC